MNSYCIYKHTFPNNKVYVGLTCQNPLDRWQGGYGYKKQRLMFNAIKKYGWDNIRHEILFDGLTLQEAHEKEIELISLYKSDDRDFGYNISSGGYSGCGHTLTEEARERIGASHRGKPLSEEHKAKLRKPHFGKCRGKRPPEVVLRLKLAAEGKRHKKAVVQFAKNGDLVSQWDSVLRVSSELGIPQSNIISVCKGKRKSAGGFIWAYADRGGERNVGLFE